MGMEMQQAAWLPETKVQPRSSFSASRGESGWSLMSSAITRSQVRRQLAAMARGYLDIGILRPDGRMLLREAWTVRQIEEAIQRLRRENARGAHVFVRPHGAHALSLVDDLSVDAIAQMTDGGFQPALVVETSPQNFQVWLNHG
jgi:hypothetical protein